MIAALLARLGFSQLAAKVILILSLTLAFVGSVGAAYLKGSWDRAAIIRAAQQEKALIAIDKDRSIALENLQAAANVSAKVKEIGSYVDRNPQRSRECLSGADTERLRDLWK
jgi:hypothetical protein